MQDPLNPKITVEIVLDILGMVFTLLCVLNFIGVFSALYQLPFHIPFIFKAALALISTAIPASFAALLFAAEKALKRQQKQLQLTREYVAINKKYFEVWQKETGQRIAPLPPDYDD